MLTLVNIWVKTATSLECENGNEQIKPKWVALCSSSLVYHLTWVGLPTKALLLIVYLAIYSPQSLNGFSELSLTHCIPIYNLHVDKSVDLLKCFIEPERIPNIGTVSKFNWDADCWFLNGTRAEQMEMRVSVDIDHIGGVFWISLLILLIAMISSVPVHLHCNSLITSVWLP